MRQQEIKILFTCMVEQYLQNDFIKGYEIDDNLDVTAYHIKNRFFAKIFNAIQNIQFLEVCRTITERMFDNKPELNPYLRFEMLGTINTGYQKKVSQVMEEIVLKLYAIHVDLDKFKSNKTIHIKITPEQQMFPIYETSVASNNDYIPIKLANNEIIGINLKKISDFVNKPEWANINTESPDPESIIQIRQMIQDASVDSKQFIVRARKSF